MPVGAPGAPREGAPRPAGRRARRVVLAIVLGLAGAGLWGGLRVTALAPRFDVPSIAAAPTWKDPVLLRRAFALPVAARYGGALVSQEGGSTCGPSSVANLLRSLGDPLATEALVLRGSGRCWLGLCLPGLTLDEVAELARARVAGRVTVLRDLSLAELREHLRRANDPDRRYLVNFHRGPLFGRGGGHHSPIGGYLADTDLVLVLDVNRDFGPWLVPAARLHQAIDLVDSSSGRRRGLLLIEATSPR